ALTGQILLYFGSEGVPSANMAGAFSASTSGEISLVKQSDCQRSAAIVSKETPAPISSPRVQTLCEILRKRLDDCSTSSRARPSLRKIGNTNLISRGPG